MTLPVCEKLSSYLKTRTDVSLMVDCSHANSQKDHAKQIGVCKSIVDQRREGSSAIKAS